MADYHGLAERLNKLVGHDSKRLSSNEVCFEPVFNECSCKGLLESHFYFYIPEDGLHAKVKEEIKKYTEKTGAHFVVTTQKCCEGNRECHGHYVDPFKAALNDKHIFIDKFPEDISGTYMHFFDSENFIHFISILRTTKLWLRQ